MGALPLPVSVSSHLFLYLIPHLLCLSLYLYIWPLLQFSHPTLCHVLSCVMPACLCLLCLGPCVWPYACHALCHTPASAAFGTCLAMPHTHPFSPHPARLPMTCTPPFLPACACLPTFYHTFLLPFYLYTCLALHLFVFFFLPAFFTFLPPAACTHTACMHAHMLLYFTHCTTHCTSHCLPSTTCTTTTYPFMPTPRTVLCSPSCTAHTLPVPALPLPPSPFIPPPSLPFTYHHIPATTTFLLLLPSFFGIGSSLPTAFITHSLASVAAISGTFIDLVGFRTRLSGTCSASL